MPSSSAPSTVSNSASSPAAWPSVRFRPRCWAHRPLPSITQATWTGMRFGSMPSRPAKPSRRATSRTYRLPRVARWVQKVARWVRRSNASSQRSRAVASDREGQLEMAEAVADAIETQRHLVVQAGTGTGKTLAYLVPAIVSGHKTVVAPPRPRRCRTSSPTRTCRSSSEHARPATSRGPSSRAGPTTCAASASPRCSPARTGSSISASTRHQPNCATRCADWSTWAEHTDTGDRAELAWEPSVAAWARGQRRLRGVPGRARCPRGDDCFAEDGQGGRGSRRRGREHPPLRHAPRERRRVAARARRGRDRRGAPARGSRVRDLRHRARTEPLPVPRPRVALA